MGVEFGCAVVRVHVEGMLGQSGDLRPEELAAEGEHEAVIGKSLLATRRCYGHKLFRCVDAGDLPFHAPDTDGVEHVIKAHPDMSQVRFVIPHANAVEGVAVDQGYFDRVGPLADFVELAGRADRAPKPGKPASQNKDSFGAHYVSGRTLAFNGLLLSISEK